MQTIQRTNTKRIHHPRQHAAAHTDDYVFSQLIPYIGNKRKLLHLIADAVEVTGVQQGTFVDLFSGSSVVSRWAKQCGYRIATNDWEPYAEQISMGTVLPNKLPAFAKLGGLEKVFHTLNNLPPKDGYIANYYCPEDDQAPDTQHERMFFTRANGQRIDAIGDQIEQWYLDGKVTETERAYIFAAFVYSVSYVSNTSGVFKGFHNGWGGKTNTALYRILSTFKLTPPLIHNNRQKNITFRQDAQQLAANLTTACDTEPDIVYIDPPYNQHPYGSNYHLLNTIVLWDKPEINKDIIVDGRKHNKSAIRTDWRTERRSCYNSAKQAADGFANLINNIQAKNVLVSYSTDGNIPLDTLIQTMLDRGHVSVVTEKYKRYRVSPTRMSQKSHNIEFVAILNTRKSSKAQSTQAIVDEIFQHEAHALAESA